jgi:hypothetical protein
MTTEQIEMAQAPAMLAGSAMAGRIIVAKNAYLESLQQDIEWTASGIEHWWLTEANQASYGRCGLMATIQGAAWMLGKMHGCDSQPIYERLSALVDAN